MSNFNSLEREVKMVNTEKDMVYNREYYDDLYSSLNVEDIVDKVKKFDTFLEDATKTDTSWHGLYLGELASRIAGKKVLELGCGSGLNALIMAALGAEVIAVDIAYESEKLIREAAGDLDLDNIEAITGDFVDLQFKADHFDFIVGKAFLHHLTHDVEFSYISRAAALLKSDGEARFLEPAVNSDFLDALRWIMPAPGRPSKLAGEKFSIWKTNDPHPERDNSSEHFVNIGKRFFNRVTVVPIGSIERFHRLIPQGDMNRKFRRWSHGIETKLPMWLRIKAARSQVIRYQEPINYAE